MKKNIYAYISMYVTGLVRSYLKIPSSNLGRRYTIECLAIRPAPTCLHAGAGLDLFRHEPTFDQGCSRNRQHRG
jgi:hypothetical protein